MRNTDLRGWNSNLESFYSRVTKSKNLRKIHLIYPRCRGRNNHARIPSTRLVSIPTKSKMHYKIYQYQCVDTHATDLFSMNIRDLIKNRPDTSEGRKREGGGEGIVDITRYTE